MYRHTEKQLKFVEFYLPFGGKLSAFENDGFARLSKKGQGPPAFSVRMALAALIIKERLGVSDEECVEQISENPYLQFFCGMEEFTTKAPLHPTMFVHFRKRFPGYYVTPLKPLIRHLLMYLP